MAGSFVTSYDYQSDTYASVHTLTITGAIANNHLFAVISHKLGPVNAPTLSAGWTILENIVTVGNVGICTAWKTAEGNSNDNLVATFGSSTRAGLLAQEITGLATDSTIDVFVSNDSGSSSRNNLNTGSATSTSDDGIHVAFLALPRNDSWPPAGTTIDSGFTNIAWDTSPTSASNRPAVNMASKPFSGGVSTEDPTFFSNSGVSNCAAAQVIARSPSGGPTPVEVQLNQAVETDTALAFTPKQAQAIQLSQAVETDTAIPWQIKLSVVAQLNQATETNAAGTWTPKQAQAIQLNQAQEFDTARQWQVGGQPQFIQLSQAVETNTANGWTVVNPNRIQLSQAVEIDTALPFTPDAPLAIQLNQAVETNTALEWRASFVQEIQLRQAIETDTAFSFTPFISTPADSYPYFRPTDYKDMYARFLGPLAQEVILLVNNGTGFDTVRGVMAHVSRWRESDMVPDGPIKLGDLRLIINAETLPLNQRPLEQKDRIEIDGRAMAVIQWDQYTRSIGSETLAIEATVRG